MRDFRFDFIRAIAIFLVICIHSMGLVNIAEDSGDSEAKVISACMNIIYCGVPLFVMLSGALLLGKEEPTIVFLKKRLSRVLIPFLLWSIVVGSILYVQEGGRSVFGCLGFLTKGILTSGVHGVYWYVYMILGLYLLTPVLRTIVQSGGGHFVVSLCVGIASYCRR